MQQPPNIRQGKMQVPNQILMQEFYVDPIFLATKQIQVRNWEK